MSLVTTKEILKKAQLGRYAVPHFNTSDLEITKAIIQGAEELNSPVIVATSKSAIEYAGLNELSGLVISLAKKSKVPVALHLDHSPTFELTKKCADNGWTSIMIDASRFRFKKNIDVTKKVVQYCHRKGIPVEAELGRLMGMEGWVKSKESVFTDPIKARDFVINTGCDSLAVSIGTSHGAYKFKGKPRLDFKRLKEIRELVSIPLVLHGASSVSNKLLNKARKYGAVMPSAQGVPERHIRKAIKLGICKINIDTDLRIAFDANIREFLYENPKVFDYRPILSHAMEGVTEVVKEKIKLFGSRNRK